MNTTRKIVMAIAIMLTITLTGCSRNEAKITEDARHQETVSILKEYYNNREAIAAQVGGGLLETIRAERNATLAVEKQRHTNALAAIAAKDQKKVAVMAPQK